jgi:hypothetical protein
MVSQETLIKTLFTGKQLDIKQGRLVAMKVSAPALTLILALLVPLIVAVQIVRIPEADPMPLLSPPPSLIISIESPIHGGWYSQDYVSLSFTLKIPNYPGFDFGYPHGDITGVSSCLDGQYYINPDSVGMRYSAVVEDLSEGWHNITITASCEHLSRGSASVVFMVDTVAPTISVLSPQNETYTITDVLLNFNASEVVKWMGYSLDGKRIVTIAGNTTLPELSFGSHSLTVYANDIVRNLGTSDTVHFTIMQETEEIPAGQPQPFPTFLVIAVLATFFVAVATCIMVYVKKHKR